jgi:hypothetical protein
MWAAPTISSGLAFELGAGFGAGWMTNLGGF